MTLKGKSFGKWASEQNIYEFQKEINPRGSCGPFLGLYIIIIITGIIIYAYNNILLKVKMEVNVLSYSFLWFNQMNYSCYDKGINKTQGIITYNWLKLNHSICVTMTWRF